MTDSGLLVAAVGVALGAAAQTVSGIGFSLVCGPFLVAVLGPARGITVAMALSLLVNLAVLVRDAGGIRWRALTALLVPAVLATPAWVALSRHLDDRTAAAVAGLSTLAGAALLASGRRWRALAGTGGAVAAGVVSAGMNVTASIAGPAAVLYADNAGWPAAAIRSTLQVYFLVLNVVALWGLGGVPSVPPVLVLALLVGAGAGGIALGRLQERTARRLTLALAAAGGAAVSLQALIGS